jgi:hypothetical protein
VVTRKRAKLATAETVDGLRDSEHAGGQLDPILTLADIREQADRDIGVGRIEVLTERLRALRPEKVKELTDAKWFKENPERSHRLRPMFPGELDPPDEAPPDHKFRVLVRQVGPGTHLRLLFCPNVNTPVPNGEALIHAIFDVVSAEGRVPGNPISTDEVAELAERYARAVRS